MCGGFPSGEMPFAESNFGDLFGLTNIFGLINLKEDALEDFRSAECSQIRTTTVW